MKKLALVAIAGSLLCGSAVAGSWVMSGLNDEYGVMAFVDVDSIDCEGKICTGWTVSTLSTSNARHDQYDLEQELLEVDCKKMKAKSLHRSKYLKGRHVFSLPPDPLFDVLVPGTIYYDSASFICGKQTGEVFFSGPAFELVKPAEEFLKKVKEGQ